MDINKIKVLRIFTQKSMSTTTSVLRILDHTECIVWIKEHWTLRLLDQI